MYNNIGGKIKGLSIAFAVIEVALAAIAGFILMITDDDMAIVGIIIIVVGSITAWISSWLLYGLGELIEDTHSIAVSNLNIRKILENKNAAVTNFGDVNTPQIQMNSNVNRQAELYQLYSKGVITAEEYQKALAGGEKA